MLSYGSNSNPLRLGHFQLSAGGEYTYFDNGGGLAGSGTYKYNNVNREVQWLSGLFNENKWGGKFEITREGKTHSISLKRGTFGSNSTDSRYRVRQLRGISTLQLLKFKEVYKL